MIVDIRMPPTYTDEGLAAARKIRAEHPGIGVLVLSQFIEPSYALRLIQDRPEGVGYLLKERIFEVANLTDALDRIQAGETVIDPAIVTRLVGRRRSPDPLEALTARELEVLGLIAEGSVEQGDRGAPVHRRAHRRDARDPDLHQARAGRDHHDAPEGPCRARLSPLKSEAAEGTGRALSRLVSWLATYESTLPPVTIAVSEPARRTQVPQVSRHRRDCAPNPPWSECDRAVHSPYATLAGLALSRSAPATARPRSAIRCRSSARTYVTRNFVVPFSVDVPPGLPVTPAADEPNFVTWVGPTS